MCYMMNADLKRTCLDRYPTFLSIEAGLRAASELSFALLCRRVREAGVMGVLSRQSECSEESSRSKSAGGLRCTRTAPTTANLISKIKFWGTGTTSTKNQIATQKRLAMTECGIRFARTTPTKKQIAAQRRLAITELCGIRFARTTPMQALLWRRVRATGLFGILSCLDEKHQQLSNPPLQACG